MFFFKKLQGNNQVYCVGEGASSPILPLTQKEWNSRFGLSQTSLSLTKFIKILLIYDSK